MQRSFYVMALIYLMSSFGCKHSQVPVNRSLEVKLPEGAGSVIDRLLLDSLDIYNQHFRDLSTGLYYDRISLGPAGDGNIRTSENISSSATGIGLVALIASDVYQRVPDAKSKVVQTLETLLKYKQMATNVWSPQGYILHWFKPDGGLSTMSYADGYSTVDTAILFAGVEMARRHFKDAKVDQLSQQLFADLNWDSAVADAETGAFYLNFDVQTKKQKTGVTRPFNEYAMIPCLAKQHSSSMKHIWERLFANPTNLPTTNFGDVRLLTDRQEHFIPHFTIQFAYYLCPDINASSVYNFYLKQFYLADRMWGQKRQTSQTLLFGMGAGSSFGVDTNGVVNFNSYTYTADAIEENPALMVSPAIMAGFAPASTSEVLADLAKLATNETCLYQLGQSKLLWRCSLHDLGQKVEGVEAIDFSTMMLGLSWARSTRMREVFAGR